MANNTLVGTSSTWTTASNWSLGAAPVTGDTVFLTSSSLIITAGLDVHTVVPAGFNVAMDFTGRLGTNGSVNTYLQIAAPDVTLGLPAVGGAQGGGSVLLNLDVGTSSATINILNSANAGSATGQAPIKLLGSALTLNQTGGVVSVAALPGETATISSMRVINSGAGIGAAAYLGPGADVGTLTLGSGSVFSYSQQAVDAATVTAQGQLTHLGTGGFTLLTVNTGGAVRYVGSGSIGTLTLTGALDLSGGGGTVTIGTTLLYAGASLNDPLGRTVFTNPPTLVGCTRNQVALNLGPGRYT